MYYYIKITRLNKSFSEKRDWSLKVKFDFFFTVAFIEERKGDYWNIENIIMELRRKYYWIMNLFVEESLRKYVFTLLCRIISKSRSFGKFTLNACESLIKKNPEFMDSAISVSRKYNIDNADKLMLLSYIILIRKLCIHMFRH